MSTNQIAPVGVPCERISREEAEKMLDDINREKNSLEDKVNEIERQLQDLEDKAAQIHDGFKAGGKEIAIGPVCVVCGLNKPSAFEMCPPCHYRVQILLLEGKTALQIAQRNRELFAIIETQKGDILRTVAG